MVNEVFENIGYFLALSLRTELLWIILPLGIATIIMLVYLGKYREEKGGWNSYVSNSLVLLFVAVILLRQIYGIDRMGSINFINYPWKFGLSLGVLFMGIVILFLNFERYLPEKVASLVSSPISLNLIAYVIILFVFTGLPLNGINEGVQVRAEVPYSEGWVVFVSLLVLFSLLVVILNGLLALFIKGFEKLRKMKEKEAFENVLSERKKIESEKKQIKLKEVKLKKDTLKKIILQKKEAEKLKRAVRKR